MARQNGRKYGYRPEWPGRKWVLARPKLTKNCYCPDGRRNRKYSIPISPYLRSMSVWQIPVFDRGPHPVLAWFTWNASAFKNGVGSRFVLFSNNIWRVPIQLGFYQVKKDNISIKGQKWSQNCANSTEGQTAGYHGSEPWKSCPPLNRVFYIPSNHLFKSLNPSRLDAQDWRHLLNALGQALTNIWECIAKFSCCVATENLKKT